MTAARFDLALTARRGLPSGTGIAPADLQRRFRRERHQPVAADDLDKLGGGPGAEMLVEGFAS